MIGDPEAKHEQINPILTCHDHFKGEGRGLGRRILARIHWIPNPLIFRKSAIPFAPFIYCSIDHFFIFLITAHSIPTTNFSFSGIPCTLSPLTLSLLSPFSSILSHFSYLSRSPFSLPFLFLCPSFKFQKILKLCFYALPT